MKLAYFPKEIATRIAQRVHNWNHFNLDEILKDSVDVVVNPNANKITDLCIQPISFPQGVEKDLWQYKAKYHKGKEQFEV